MCHLKQQGKFTLFRYFPLCYDRVIDNKRCVAMQCRDANQNIKKFSLRQRETGRRAYARNVRLRFLYRQYHQRFIFRVIETLVETWKN